MVLVPSSRSRQKAREERARILEAIRKRATDKVAKAGGGNPHSQTYSNDPDRKRDTGPIDPVD